MYLPDHATDGYPDKARLFCYYFLEATCLCIKESHLVMQHQDVFIFQPITYFCVVLAAQLWVDLWITFFKLNHKLLGNIWVVWTLNRYFFLNALELLLVVTDIIYRNFMYLEHLRFIIIWVFTKMQLLFSAIVRLKRFRLYSTAFLSPTVMVCTQCTILWIIYWCFNRIILC